MKCRGVRGATTIAANTREEILTGTRQLLALMIRANGIEPQDVASVLFSTTTDIDAEFPALAAYVARGEARPAYKRAFAAQWAVNARPNTS